MSKAKTRGPGKKQKAVEAAAMLTARGYTLDYSEGALMGISRVGGPNYSILNIMHNEAPADLAALMRAVDTYAGEVQPDFMTTLAGFPISLTHTSKNRFTVVYGAQVDTGLDYHDAASAIGCAIMHALTCEGEFDNATRPGAWIPAEALDYIAKNANEALRLIKGGN